MSDDEARPETRPENCDSAEILLTPTQERMLALLADGRPKLIAALFLCVGDDLAQVSVVRQHVRFLRIRLVPLGLDVISCRVGKSKFYRLVADPRPVLRAAGYPDPV